MKGLHLFGKKKGRKAVLFSGLLLLVVFFTPQAAHAAMQVKTAIFNFIALNMEASGYGTAVTNMLGDSLKADLKYDVLDRKDLEAFLNLNDYRQDDKVENAVQIGTRLGLNIVIVGNVERKGAWIIVNCRMVSVEQKKIILNTRVGAQGDAGL
jgi:TolB-like protein